MLSRTFSSKTFVNKGITLFFTGLSGSGKTTIVNEIYSQIVDKTDKSVVILDGDEVRTFLSSELTFSKEHRDLNIKRIGYVAGLVSGAGGIVLTGAIAPYKETRYEAKKLVEKSGAKFMEIYVDTDLETCEKRDVKGLYKLAREGKIENFTGISDPYEKPLNPNMSIKTENNSIYESADQVIKYLTYNNYIQ